MKKEKIVYFGLLSVFFFFLLSSCQPQARLPVAGQAQGQDMLTLLPVDTSAFLVVDWNRLMSLNLVKKTFQEQPDFNTYQQKIKAFNLDLNKDIYFVAAAITGEMSSALENLAILVNLKYQKDKLLPPNPEKESNLENYQGIPFLPFIEIERKAVVCVAFLDNSNLAIGSEKAIKKIIDVYTKKTPNLLNNKNLKPYLKDINLKALSFGFLTVPAELLQKEVSNNPSLQLWKNVRYISSFADQRQNFYLSEIKIYATNKEDHKKLAETITGIKALGMVMSGQLPELGQALEALEITSTDRYVKIFLTLNEDSLNKLKEALKEKSNQLWTELKK